MWLAWLGGCAASARFLLFSGSPAFELTAAPDHRSTALVAQGLTADDFADDLCGEDDGESCRDDVSLGLGFYRSDDGPYGAFALVGALPVGEVEWVDPDAAGPETAWRAALLRQEIDPEDGPLDPYVDAVSTAAALPDPAG